MSEWLGASWATIGYVVLGTLAIYVSTFVAVRLAGRRTVAQLSAFDFVVTIALGSLIASTAVAKDPSYLQGLAALITLVVLQVTVGALRQAVPRLREVLDFPPEPVIRDGELDLRRSPFTAQLTPEEVEGALRHLGVFDRSRVRIMILEPGGEFSVDLQDTPDSGR